MTSRGFISEIVTIILLLSFGTSAKRFESENRLFLLLSDGTKYVLKAPGKEWKRDLSIPNVRIWYIEGFPSETTHEVQLKKRLHVTEGQSNIDKKREGRFNNVDS